MKETSVTINMFAKMFEWSVPQQADLANRIETARQ